MTEWQPDVLGAGFECLTFELGPEHAGHGEQGREGDGEVSLCATLVRSLPAPLTLMERLRRRTRSLEQVDVLYVHGWNDYFFQKSVAQHFTRQGARFYALDLRRYGRSLREDQMPGYIEDLSLYDTEIGLAIDTIRSDPAPQARTGTARKLLLLGHSTGGLVLSLWASRHPGVADGLLLNSPWLELQLSGAARKAIAPVLNLRARLRPLAAALPQIDGGFYAKAQHSFSTPDEIALINRMWRPEQSWPIITGWLHAILDGHSRVAAGLQIDVPTCVLLSGRSEFALEWNDRMLSADTVLEVESIAKASLKLGQSVTIERIDGALHDVFLSEPEVRRQAFGRVDRWLAGWLASPAT